MIIKKDIGKATSKTNFKNKHRTLITVDSFFEFYYGTMGNYTVWVFEQTFYRL